MQSVSAKLRKLVIVQPKVSRETIDNALAEVRFSSFNVEHLLANVAMHRALMCKTFGAALTKGFPGSLYDIFYDARTTEKHKMPREPWLEQLLTIEECREIIAKVTCRKRNVKAYIKARTLPAYRFSAKTIRVSYNDLVQFIQEEL